MSDGVTRHSLHVGLLMMVGYLSLVLLLSEILVMQKDLSKLMYMFNNPMLMSKTDEGTNTTNCSI